MLILIDPEAVAEYMAMVDWERTTSLQAEESLYDMLVDANGNGIVQIRDEWATLFFNLKEAYLLVLNEFKSSRKWQLLDENQIS